MPTRRSFIRHLAGPSFDELPTHAATPDPRTNGEQRAIAGVATERGARDHSDPQAGKMSNRHHLPAGQNLQGPPGVDMSGGPRRRQQPPPQYAPQYHPHMNPMYQNYVPYAPQQYYGVPPPYQNGAMASPGYMPYQNYARSPPNMQQYVPMVGVSVPPAYPRAAPRSPALSTPYLPPPVQAPILPQTPSSTHSGHFPPSPTPPAPQPREPVPAPAPARSPSPVIAQAPFRPPVRPVASLFGPR